MPRLLKQAKPLARIKEVDPRHPLWRAAEAERELEIKSKGRPIISSTTALRETLGEGRVVATTSSNRGESQLPREEPARVST